MKLPLTSRARIVTRNVVRGLSLDRIAWQAEYATIIAEKALRSFGMRGCGSWNLPNFLGIGAPRAGTSWLHTNLAAHPNIALPPMKELHYFDSTFPVGGTRAYARHFADSPPGVKQGEITPAYITLSADRVRLIHELMPDLRLILLLRNPIDRAWSWALAQLVVWPERRYEDVSDDDFYRHFASPQSLLRGDYARALNTWLSVYGRQQIFLGFYEDLRERPCGLLAEVFEHIGVAVPLDWSAFPTSEVVSPSIDTPLPPRSREFLEKLYRDRIEALPEALGPRALAWRIPG